MKISADCKINLHLHIKEKLPDGYHSLETVFHQIPFGDEIDIVTSDDGLIHFSSSGIEIPDGGTNICVKAAELLRNLCGKNYGCRIRLKKNVPIGAGLGGGSSDAASVLKALNNIWQLNLTKAELERAGLELGADVPFFISGGCAWAEGKGEILTALEPLLEKGVILLVYPYIHISTPWAYKNLNLNLTKSGDNVIFAEVSKKRASRRHCKEMFFNDFEALVFEKYPEIGKIKKMMIDGGADLSAMSGSGSAVFGYFPSGTVPGELMSKLGKSCFVKAVKL